MPENKQYWYHLNNPEQIASPCLLVYPERIEKNIVRMIELAGGTAMLRPHIKTHKTAEIIEMQMAHGISKFKCATLPEADLLGRCGAKDILLAMQPVGVNIERYFDLLASYPESQFSVIADNPETIKTLSDMAGVRKTKTSLFLDLNTGMNRTGVVPGPQAAALYRSIASHPQLVARGFHVYDGHLRFKVPKEQKQACDKAFAPVWQLKESLESEGIRVAAIIAGGSPTFPVHAGRPGVEASPGTTLLWDEGYGNLFPEMGFLHAAVLLTRIISKPQPSLCCLDLGHKAIAPEMSFPRVRIFGMEDCEQIAQSEEHLVVQCPEDKPFVVGEVLYAIPVHICPTVAKYPALLTVENGQITGSWRVAARDH